MRTWTTLVLTGLACCLTLPALAAVPNGDDPQVWGCLPPPLTKDYVKKTVRVEIKGKLQRVRLPIDVIPLDQLDPNPPRTGPLLPRWDEVWQITVGDKTYILDLGDNSDVEKGPITRGFTDLARKLAGKTVIITGMLNGDTVQVTGLKADEEYVKQTTEVEVRGQLQGIRFEPVIYKTGGPMIDIYVPPHYVAWNLVVDGKTYSVSFPTPELARLAETLDGKAVVISGELKNDVITVKTLKAAAE
jgi:hypothetical protein